MHQGGISHCTNPDEWKRIDRVAENDTDALYPAPPEECTKALLLP